MSHIWAISSMYNSKISNAKLTTHIWFITPQEYQRWCMQCPTHRAASLIWTTGSNDVSHDLGKPCSRHPHTWAHKPYTLCIWLILTAPGWFPLLVFPLHYTLWCPPLLLHLATLNSIAQSSSAHSSSSSSHYPVWKPTHETTITSLSLYKHHCSASQPPMNVQNLQEFKVWGCEGATCINHSEKLQAMTRHSWGHHELQYHVQFAKVQFAKGALTC